MANPLDEFLLKEKDQRAGWRSLARTHYIRLDQAQPARAKDNQIAKHLTRFMPMIP
jgi:hypothetical protein